MELEQRIQQSWRRSLEYLRTGNLPAAQACFEGILARDPGHLQACLQLATVQMRRGSARSALAFAERAHALAPDDFEALALLIKLLVLSGKTSRARDLALHAIPGDSESVSALDAIGVALSQLREHRRALDFFDASLATPPFSAAQYFNRALAHLAASQTAEYEQDLATCLALDPGHAKAHWHQARLHRRGRGSGHVETLRRLLESRNIDDAEREVLSLALLHELDGLGRHADAWQALAGAMTCRSGQAPGEPLQWSAFKGLVTEPLPPPSTTRGPVFVVGLPQSGVAVLGRLLERHPQVVSLGSVPAFSRRFNAFMAQSLGEYSRWELAAAESASVSLDYEALGRDYAEHAGAGGGDMVTCECIPMNALMVGAIARALPSARFLHVSRDARDNALSLLAQPRGDAQLANESIAMLDSELGRHRQLMQHWHDCLPGRIMDVQYESLVRKPAMVLRVACAFLGLRYTAGLDSHDLHDRRIGCADPYADQLGAFADLSALIS